MAAVLVLSPAASADDGSLAGGERHCVVAVIAQVDGVLVTGPERCFATEREAAEFEPPDWRDGANRAGLSSTTIGRHFTGQSYTGSSIRIVGTVCSGGTWPASGSWNNNIESSEHHCGASPTTFYDSSSCSGTNISITAPSPTLGGMNNRTSCVRYG